ncbi:TetR/AcrR family transcriptional regulator [Pseudohalocynthiibacter aestuariivivens]|uniref:TetR/AcrR family transcriptional regulator n=1 Tax=Pseudohalocynthiibacter aestuariivivens TaxID=1591409 RepID=A0ABV5JF65_9RHOB|nr:MULTISPECIES: helix-turn-helix domain-containing protein [Pseudohalocynthiibacter]MCK0103616.1 TetR/AcrR family transcriptional regulator [Pseudohalocynthiibacter sp. F2068]
MDIQTEMNASAKVFNQNGFGATGMDRIGEETGISKTSIYNHFCTKDDLVLAVLRLREEWFRNWLYRRIEELAGESKEQLIVRCVADSHPSAAWFLECKRHKGRHPHHLFSQNL